MIIITLYWWFVPLTVGLVSLLAAAVCDDVMFGNKSLFWLSVGTFTPIGMVIGHFLG